MLNFIMQISIMIAVGKRGSIMEIKDYKKLIDKATTKDELQNITYKCLKEQGQTLNSKKYNKVVDLAIQRQIKLGIK